MGSRDQIPLDGLLLEDFDIVLHVGRSPDLLGKPGQVYGTAHILERAFLLKLGADSDDVDGRVLQDKGRHRLKDHLVALIVETRRRKLLHRLIDGDGLDKHRSQDSFFNIKSLRGFIAHLKPYGVQIYCLILLSGRRPLVGFRHKNVVS